MGKDHRKTNANATGLVIEEEKHMIKVTK